MHKNSFLLLALTFLLLAYILPANSEDTNTLKPDQEVRKLMEPTREIIFKTIGDVKLHLYVFEPENLKPTDRRPAIVFFFGGGWTGGSPGQFYPQCKYLASRGMVAISAEYRVKSRHDVTPFECVTDGKSAVRWIRANAGRLGVDPDHIAAGGGSAGGHVAACTGVIDGLEESSEELAISSRPNALVLFNPALVMPWRDESEWSNEEKERFMERFQGRDPKEISPYHHVKPDDPPTIIFHGEADTTIPVSTARMFLDAMKKAGNQCELVTYKGKSHGFFNYGRGEEFYYTLSAADRFLIDLGYLKGPDTIEQFRKSLQ